jgi:hypothetical protein
MTLAQRLSRSDDVIARGWNELPTMRKLGIVPIASNNALHRWFALRLPGQSLGWNVAGQQNKGGGGQ